MKSRISTLIIMVIAAALAVCLVGCGQSSSSSSSASATEKAYKDPYAGIDEYLKQYADPSKHRDSVAESELIECVDKCVAAQFEKGGVFAKYNEEHSSYIIATVKEQQPKTSEGHAVSGKYTENYITMMGTIDLYDDYGKFVQQGTFSVTMDPWYPTVHAREQKYNSGKPSEKDTVIYEEVIKDGK